MTFFNMFYKFLHGRSICTNKILILLTKVSELCITLTEEEKWQMHMGEIQTDLI